MPNINERFTERRDPGMIGISLLENQYQIIRNIEGLETELTVQNRALAMLGKRKIEERSIVNERIHAIQIELEATKGDFVQTRSKISELSLDEVQETQKSLNKKIAAVKTTIEELRRSQHGATSAREYDNINRMIDTAIADEAVLTHKLALLSRSLAKAA